MGEDVLPDQNVVVVMKVAGVEGGKRFIGRMGFHIGRDDEVPVAGIGLGSDPPDTRQVLQAFNQPVTLTGLNVDSEPQQCLDPFTGRRLTAREDTARVRTGWCPARPQPT